MKVSCLQENLAKGLSIVSRAVQPRSPLPVLGNILIATDAGRLKLAATNRELSITCWIGAKVDEEGAITLPARTLQDFVNSLPPERIDLDLNEKTQTLHLKCARYDANIKGIDASEFPTFPTIAEYRRPGGTSQLTIEPDTLREIIEQVAFAAATDDTRSPVLTGVLAKFEKEKLTFASADGFRLSIRHATLGASVEQPISVIIPAKTLQEVGRVSGDQEEPIEMAVTSNQAAVLFKLTNIEMVSQLIDGNFPDFMRVIPDQHTTRTTVSTSELQNAVKASSVFAREENNSVKVQIGNGKLTIAAVSRESGDNVGDVDANVDGDAVEIAFNARFLADVLNVVHAPQVVIETSGSTKPGVFRIVGRDDFMHVIMPMHLPEAKT